MSSLKHAGMGYSTRGSVSEAAQATCTGTGDHDHCATRPPHPRTARWPPPHHVEVHFLDSARDGVAHHQLPPPSAIGPRLRRAVSEGARREVPGPVPSGPRRAAAILAGALRGVPARSVFRRVRSRAGWRRGGTTYARVWGG